MRGTLVCRARNSYGSSESRATVEVKEIEKKPEFVKTPQDHTVEEETMVKFSAIVTGRPVPTVSWYRNETKIETNEEMRVKYEESTGKTSIKIFKPKESDSGKVCYCKIWYKLLAH